MRFSSTVFQNLKRKTFLKIVCFIRLRVHITPSSLNSAQSLEFFVLQILFQWFLVSTGSTLRVVCVHLKETSFIYWNCVRAFCPEIIWTLFFKSRETGFLPAVWKLQFQPVVNCGATLIYYYITLKFLKFMFEIGRPNFKEEGCK